MRKIRKRVFAAVLVAGLLFTMPGMASVAAAEDGHTEDISESVTMQAEDDAVEETGAETEAMQESEAEDSDTDRLETGDDDTGDTETGAQEPAEEETVPTQKADTEECTCGTLCIEDSINGDCLVCGVEDADLSHCEGEKTEISSEKNKKDIEQGDTGERDVGTSLCAHHKDHTQDCGYNRAAEDGEGSLCTYECRICPIENLLAALPDAVTEDNRAEVEVQLEEILDLFRELTEDEQEQIDISHCLELQEVLDAANVPASSDEPTEGAVAKVEKEGEAPNYVPSLAEAFADENSGATITLLENVTLSDCINIYYNRIFTLDLNGHMISCSYTAFRLNAGSFLTIRDSGENGGIATYADSHAVAVLGTLTLEGGHFSTSGDNYNGVNVYNNTVLNVIGEDVYINKLFVDESQGVTLSAGTYGSITSRNSLDNLLGENCAYYGADGKPLVLDGLGGAESMKVLTGPVTVRKCQQDVEDVKQVQHNDGTETHTMTCLACGYTEVADCDYVAEYKYDKATHTQTCTLCGYEKEEAHTLKLAAEAKGTVITASDVCDCGYTNTLGTVTLTILENLTYGETKGKEVEWKTDLQLDGNRLDFQVDKRALGGYDGPCPLPELSAGEHTLEIGVILDRSKYAQCSITFTVSAVPLTEDMVTLSLGSATYSGAEQKPTITVQKGETTLAEGTDYDITYSTSDFTNAGEVTITIEGKGNYKGTVTKTYKINKVDVPANDLQYTPPGDLVYTGAAKTAAVTADSLSGIGQITVKYKKDNKGDFLTEAVEPGTYHVYAVISGATNYNDTQIEMGNFTIEKAPGRTIPDLKGSYTDDGRTYTYTITPTEGAVYRMGDGAWTEVNVFKGITPGTAVTFSAKMPENENYKEGEAKSLTVDFPKFTPAAPALSYTRKTDRKTGNITLTITETAGAEYSFDGGATWQDTAKQDGFDASQTVTLAIRLKGTETHNPSPAQTMTVNLAREDREAPPPFTLQYEANGETGYTVTIPPTEGCEYSFDGETWSESNIKTSVKVGETVTGYKRYKETDEYNVSSAVFDSETMPKFTVKTPVVSPAEGSYFGNISVTITCGSPDALIYYTTDGNMPTSSSTRYTGAFTVSAPATVRAIAMKEGLIDSAVVTAIYTKQDSGSSDGSGDFGGGNSGEGGNGSGSGDSGDNGQGNNEDKVGENTTPILPVIPPIPDTNSGTGAEAVKPGTGNAVRLGTGNTVEPGNGNTVNPGTETESGGGSAEETRPKLGIPFIKGEDGKIGWDVIRAEEEQTKEGSVINVDMNGITIVPDDIFDRIKGRDITITFDIGSGIIWSVDGKSITRDAFRDKAGDIDFDLKTGVNAVPADIVNNITGESYSIQISLAHEGEFGFTAVLSINLGKENAGHNASLYYYNAGTGKLEFICADTVAEDGTSSLAFTHASDYVIAIDGDEEESGTVMEAVSSTIMEPAQLETSDGNGDGAVESPQTGQAWKPWWFIVAGVLVILVGIGVFFVVTRKKRR